MIRSKIQHTKYHPEPVGAEWQTANRFSLHSRLSSNPLHPHSRGPDWDAERERYWQSDGGANGRARVVPRDPPGFYKSVGQLEVHCVFTTPNGTIMYDFNRTVTIGGG
ncbi:hypothetical protein AHF37_09210 [Paragonimus kellicotti]|nr:hypothetical protein AHF37_09210 [Paragonimus kellicotti]